MLAYRIALKKYSFNLEASGIEGRWNKAGQKVVYAAESTALALLENMFRRKGTGFNKDFRIMILEFPDNMKITVINEKPLASGWRDFRDYSICQAAASNWFTLMKTVILKVPSAVLPEANNFVFNAVHPDFRKVHIVATLPFIPDERIEDILKKYRKP